MGFHTICLTPGQITPGLATADISFGDGRGIPMKLHGASRRRRKSAPKIQIFRPSKKTRKPPHSHTRGLRKSFPRFPGHFSDRQKLCKNGAQRCQKDPLGSTPKWPTLFIFWFKTLSFFVKKLWSESIQPATGCYRLLQAATGCYRLSQAAACCHRLLQTATGWRRLSHAVTGCYKLSKAATC